ncbi:MAG: lysoplasmalogenase [Spirochaetales bacterium]|nr:lysoplasmalogenase [Spirochaetales bacterium]
MIVLIIIQALFLVLLLKAEFAKDMTRIRVYKPLETGMVVLIALVGNSYALTIPGLLILAGLVFSFTGDIALINPDNTRFFAGGLGAFLAAHILYTAAFIRIAPGFWITPGPLAAAGILGIFALVLFLLMAPRLKKMTVPVVLYIIVISLMVQRSVVLLLHTDPVSVFARYNVSFFAGAFLFYISDVILAYNRFVRPLKYNRISLLFYYTGQTLIAIGTLGAGGIFF